jgi:dimethylglycine dehydrogenase
MKSQYRVVVIGGGVVGASIAYHLTKFGWNDVAITERSILTAGSSWHAAGGYHALNADPNIASLQAYTIDVLSQLEAETGQATGIRMTGGITFACTPDRWEWLQAAYRVFQTMGIEDVRLMSPEEIKAACPIISIDGVKGGMWADREGYVDTTGVVHAYAKGAKMRGAEVIEHNRMLELRQRREGGWDVVTERGTIIAEHVVNAAGLWAKQVGRMVGLDLPVSPLEHHYLVTESVPEIAALDFEVPMMVDLDGFTYARQDQKGMLVGIYEIDHKHWNMDGAPWDYGFELIPENLDRIENELQIGFSRYPALERAGIKRWVNGAFTFTPDGNPLVGPVHGLPGYWLACGVMAGFLQGGGVGKSLAEWMIHGEPSSDIYGMDVARYGAFASNREYIKQMTGQFYSRRFVMTYPNEQLWAARPLKTSPAYDAMTANGARWGVSWGLEVPIYFARKDFEETPTLKRSNASDIIADECRRTADGVGIVDTSGFSRFEVTGPKAPEWLDRLVASRLPKPGRCRLAPMLSPTGKLKGDVTIFNGGRECYWIMGSYYLRQWHMRWFLDHIEDGVSVRDISDATVGFALAGPRSRELLQSLTNHDVSSTGLLFMACAEFDVGLIAIDPDGAGFERGAAADGPADIASPQPGGQAVGAVVGDRKDFVFVVERDDREDRTEHFLTRDAHVVADAGEDGRLHEPAGCQPRGLRPAAAQHTGGAALLRDVNVAQHLVALGQRRDRPDLRVRPGGIADPRAARQLDDAFDHLVVDLALHQQARAGKAGLPSRREDARHRAVDRALDVGIGKHDIGRLAAELERHRFQASGHRAIDGKAAGLSAGERHLRNVGMRDQRHAGLRRKSRHRIHHAGREAGLGEQLREGEGRGGGVLGRLDDHRVARGKRRRQLPGQEQQRRVPRHNRHDHADRLAPGEGEHAGLVDRQHSTFDLVRQPAEIAVPLRRVADLHRHLVDELAVVAGLDGGEALGIGGDQVGKPDHQLAARGRRQPAPLLGPECLRCCRHSAIDVGGVAAWNEGPRIAGERVEALERRGGLLGGTRDQVGIADELGHDVLLSGRKAEMSAEPVLDEDRIA